MAFLTHLSKMAYIARLSCAHKASKWMGRLKPSPKEVADMIGKFLYDRVYTWVRVLFPCVLRSWLVELPPPNEPLVRNKGLTAGRMKGNQW